jgi:hypothetical protein
MTDERTISNRSPSFSPRAHCVRCLARHFTKISNPRHCHSPCYRLPCCRCPTCRRYRRHHPPHHRPPHCHRPMCCRCRPGHHHCSPCHCQPPAAQSRWPLLCQLTGGRYLWPAPLWSRPESPPARVTRHPRLTGSSAPARVTTCSGS